MTSDPRISTSSPGSEASLLPQRGQAARPLPSASEIPMPSESSQKTSPESLPSMTSSTLTGKSSEGQMSFPGDFLANHTRRPGSEEARKMTERSGRKWLASYRRQDPSGSLARTFLASSRWVSTKSFLTWKILTTTARRSLFRLAPLMPSTKGIESGLLLPTPRVSDTEGGLMKNVEMHRGSFSRVNKKGERWGVKLKDAINFLENEKSGDLNPEFVEWLMGYPTGWTDLKDSATQSSHKSPLSSSE